MVRRRRRRYDGPVATPPKRRPRSHGTWRRLRRRVSRERLRWAVRIRTLAIALFLAVAVAAHAAGHVPALLPVLAAAGVGGLMNAAATMCVRRWRGIGAMILGTGIGDAVLITVVVWTTGGVQSPFLFLYAVQVVTAALVLGVRMAALAGGLGLTLLAGVLLRAGSTPSGDEPDRIAWLLSLALTLVFLGFIGGHLTRRLARTERELAGAHGRLARSLRRLGRAHRELQDAYARLARAESQLVAVEKMRAFGVLVAGVAHELGNPLTVLAGNLDPLADAIASYEGLAAAHDAGDAADEWRREAPLLVAGCRDATERAVALLVQLRSFGRRPPTAELRLAPLRPGLESTLALVRHRLPAGVRVEARYADVPDVACDPLELNQVFMNVLLNAADALRPGGRLRVALEHRDDAVTVSVGDDGVGIAAADLPHVFEPFFTTKEVGQGSGLGLAISQAIVARHGGSIEARAPAGGGTEIRVTLPVGASRPGGRGAGSAPQVGGWADVELVAQAVAEKVEREHREHDGEAGKEREVGGDQDEGAAVVQHRAP